MQSYNLFKEFEPILTIGSIREVSEACWTTRGKLVITLCQKYRCNIRPRDYRDNGDSNYDGAFEFVRH
jgi:hypothetical protein